MIHHPCPSRSNDDTVSYLRPTDLRTLVVHRGTWHKVPVLSFPRDAFGSSRLLVMLGSAHVVSHRVGSKWGRGFPRGLRRLGRAKILFKEPVHYPPGATETTWEQGGRQAVEGYRGSEEHSRAASLGYHSRCTIHLSRIKQIVPRKDVAMRGTGGTNAKHACTVVTIPPSGPPLDRSCPLCCKLVRNQPLNICSARWVPVMTSTSCIHAPRPRKHAVADTKGCRLCTRESTGEMLACEEGRGWAEVSGDRSTEHVCIPALLASLGCHQRNVTCRLG